MELTDHVSVSPEKEVRYIHSKLFVATMHRVKQMCTDDLQIRKLPVYILMGTVARCSLQSCLKEEQTAFNTIQVTLVDTSANTVSNLIIVNFEVKTPFEVGRRQARASDGVPTAQDRMCR